jgi:hypothetical protein
MIQISTDATDPLRGLPRSFCPPLVNCGDHDARCPIPANGDRPSWRLIVSRCRSQERSHTSAVMALHRRTLQPQTAGKYTETLRAFTRKKFTILPAGVTRGTAYRDSLEKQPEPPKDTSIAETATMAEQYKLTSTGEFGFAECPLNPALKSPGASGFLVVAEPSIGSPAHRAKRQATTVKRSAARGPGGPSRHKTGNREELALLRGAVLCDLCLHSSRKRFRAF